MKCDEAKPACERCFRGGHECDGYDTRTSTTNGRLILPRFAVNFQPIFYEPRKHLFQNELEHRYFRLFRETMVPQLSGYFDSDLWRRLVLQASEQDVSLRNGITALAALKAASEVIYSADYVAGRCDDVKIHHQFALRKYSKALHAMSRAASEGKQDLRTTLISSVVIGCIETLLGNHESAVKQAIIGLELIESSAADEKSSVIKIEDDIISAFERFDIQAMTYVDPRTAQRHGQLKDLGSSQMEDMPDEFVSLEEARIYLELVMRRCMHFMASLLPNGCTSGLMSLDISLCIPEEHVDGRERHLDEHRRWYAAFKPIFQKSQKQKGDEFLQATALNLQYLGSYFASAIIRTSNQPCSDSSSLMPIFEQIVSDAEAILDHPGMVQEQGTYVYTSEIQVVSSLYGVSWRCPKNSLRRKAISLLLSNPRRESLWDSVLAGKLSEWILLNEEKEFKGEYMPEDLKLLSVEIRNVQMTSRSVQIRFTSHQRITRETVLFW